MIPEQPLPKRESGSESGWDVAYLVSWLICISVFIAFIVWVKSVDYSMLSQQVDLQKLSPRVLKIILPPKSKTPDAAERKAKLAAEAKAKQSAPADLAVRIQKARESVQENMQQAQERVTKAAVLSILTGKGPSKKGGEAGGKLKKAGFGDWDDLNKRLETLEGLTRYDAKQGSQNRDGVRPSATEGSAATLTDLVRGFEDAKVGALKKIGDLKVEKPEILTSGHQGGNRDPAQMSAFINQRQASISMLYEERLKINPSMEGKVTLLIVIEADGRVSTVRVVPGETTLKDTAFHEALMRRIRNWRFPTTQGGAVEIKSPFVFRPV